MGGGREARKVSNAAIGELGHTQHTEHRQFRDKGAHLLAMAFESKQQQTNIIVINILAVIKGARIIVSGSIR